MTGDAAKTSQSRPVLGPETVPSVPLPVVVPMV